MIPMENLAEKVIVSSPYSPRPADSGIAFPVHIGY